MDNQSITVGLSPDIEIESVQGNLLIKGWDRPQIFAKAETQAALHMEKQGNRILVVCQSDLILRVPRAASVNASQVNGCVRAKYLDKRLIIDRVGGSLGMRNIGSVQVGTVQGDLLVKQVQENLQVDRVIGSAIIRDVQGDCTIQKVDKLDLRDCFGDVSLSVESRARLGWSQMCGSSYSIICNEHIHIRVPDEASLAVSLSSQAEEIHVHLPHQKETIRQAAHHLTLGSGEAVMTVSARGLVFFTSQENDWDDTEVVDVLLNEEFTRISDEFTERIERQFDTQMEALNQHMEMPSEAIRKSGLSQGEREPLVHRAQESSQQAAARAQEKMLSTQEKLEHEQHASFRKVDRDARQVGRRRQDGDFERTLPPTSAMSLPSGKAEPIREEERILILRMLEQKKITLEEAEMLLAALEGNPAED